MPGTDETTSTSVHDLPVADRLGVCAIRGRYAIGDEPQLLAGALRTLELGSRVVKLWFRYPLSTNGYPLQPWPEAGTLREMAELPAMREVFSLPFTTIILSLDATTTQAHGWSQRLPDDLLRSEADQLEDLVEHLATTYGHTGKTFVLQNWEGDWAAKGCTDKEVASPTSSLDAMVQRLRIRQEAVERGRRAAPASVLHAPEVNLVLPGSQAGQSVTEAVLPHVGCDLYSYSAWETTWEDGSRFVEALDRIRDAAGCRPDQVFLGEFGAPEQAMEPAHARTVLERTIEDGLRWGCRYLVYWAMFCNETRKVPQEGQPFPDHPGFWLIRPDGTRAPSWDILADALREPATG